MRVVSNVAPYCVIIEPKPVPGFIRELEPAASGLDWIGHQPLEINDVEVRRKVFNREPVWRRCDEMRMDLRCPVWSNWDIEACCHLSNAPPLRNSAANCRIRLQDIDG